MVMPVCTKVLRFPATVVFVNPVTKLSLWTVKLVGFDPAVQVNVTVSVVGPAVTVAAKFVGVAIVLTVSVALHPERPQTLDEATL